MKSSLGKLKRFAANKSDDGKDRKDHHRQTLAHLDGLAQASQDMKDIRSYYDSLLSTAAASANSAYEFSESLLEMGNCLLQKTALSDDGDCGRGLSMLGRVQLELRKIVDSYRAHIILTITKPSESLLNELRKVEEMKLQCDEKREVYKYLLTQHKDKGRSRGGKGDNVTSEQLQAAREEYDDAARLCVFRVESLKQGQCRSLFTQAARHHAAQLNFFRRGVESLEAVEPHVKTVAVKQHIDYQLSGLGDVENEDGEEVTSYESNNDGDLSFDHGLNKQEIHNAGTLRNSVEVDAPGMQTSATEDAVTSMGRSQGEQFSSWQSRAGSHSAPIYAEKFDFAEKIKDAQTTVRKFHTHVLPTPADAKSWNSRTSNSLLHSSSTGVSGGSNNLWHSSPLQTEKQRRSTEDNLLARNTSKSQLVDKDSNNSNPPIPLPTLAEGVPVQQSDAQNEFDYEKLKRLAFSGPIASKTPSSKPSLYSSGQFGSSEQQPLNSGLYSRIPIGQLSSSINVSHGASPPPVSSPRISELHELPRPPGSIASKPVGSGVTGHSVPLGNRKREVSPTSRSPLLASNTKSALPPPPLTVPRSFSIPSSSQRAMAVHMARLLESPRSRGRAEEVASPPLTPISLANMKSEVASNSGHIKVNAGGR